MKYPSLKMIKSIKSPKIRGLLLFFIVLPFLAILGAGIISRLFVVPYLSDNLKSQGAASEIVKEEKNNKKYCFYLLQIGVFSSDGNAKVMSGEIELSGLRACVVKDGEVYRVIGGAGKSKEEIDDYGARFKQSGYISMVKEYKAQEDKLQESSENVLWYVSAAGELVSMLIDNCAGDSELKYEETIKIKDCCERLQKCFSSVKEEEAALLEKYYKRLIDTTGEFINYPENIEKRMLLAYECAVGYSGVIGQ